MHIRSNPGAVDSLCIDHTPFVVMRIARAHSLATYAHTPPPRRPPAAPSTSASSWWTCVSGRPPPLSRLLRSPTTASLPPHPPRQRTAPRNGRPHPTTTTQALDVSARVDYWATIHARTPDAIGRIFSQPLDPRAALSTAVRGAYVRLAPRWNVFGLGRRAYTPPERDYWVAEWRRAGLADPFGGAPSPVRALAAPRGGEGDGRILHFSGGDKPWAGNGSGALCPSPTSRTGLSSCAAEWPRATALPRKKRRAPSEKARRSSQAPPPPPLPPPLLELGRASGARRGAPASAKRAGGSPATATAQAAGKGALSSKDAALRELIDREFE